MRPPREILEKLYLTNRLTTRAIGAQFGVSKTEVRRWLIRYDIPRRGVGRGLVARDLPYPDAATLRSLIHEHRLSYVQIGKRYGVDNTAVTHWVRKHGITSLSPYVSRLKGRVLPSPSVVKGLYESGFSLDHIGSMYHVSLVPIRRLAVEAGLEVKPGGWQHGRRWVCADGHTVRSTYEMRVDDWLREHGILHRPEPRIPYTTQWRADCWADGWYIEIWGVINRPSYRQRKEEKRAHYQRHGIPLLELSPHDFSSRSRDRWHRKLSATFLVPLPATG